MAQNNRQVNPFQNFKPGNSVKVETGSGDLFKGIYLGTEFDTGYQWTSLEERNKKGLYIVFLALDGKPAVLDIVEQIRFGKTYIKRVDATRLTGKESAVLRSFYKEFEKRRNEEQVHPNGVLDKSEVRELMTNNEYGLDITEWNNNGIYCLSANFEGVHEPYQFGLEYEDGDLDKEIPPKMSEIEEYLSFWYPNATIDNYRKLVDKYNHMVEFNDNFYSYHEHGNNLPYPGEDGNYELYYELGIWIEMKFRDKYVSKVFIEALLKDLSIFKRYMLTIR